MIEIKGIKKKVQKSSFKDYGNITIAAKELAQFKGKEIVFDLIIHEVVDE